MHVNLYLLEYVKMGISIVMLAYTAILDVKYREVDPRIWLFFGIPLTAITSYEVYNLILSGIHIYKLITFMCISIGVPCTLMFALAYLELIGGADFLALLVLSIAHPWKPLEPLLNIIPFFPLSLLANSSLIALTPTLYHLALNMIIYRDIVKNVKLPPIQKALLILIGRPMKVKEYLKTKYMYILGGSEGGDLGEIRLSFKVSIEPEEERRRVNELLKSKHLRENDYLWVTEGLPMLLPILIGYLLTLTIGDFTIYPIIVILHGIVKT